MRLSGHKIASAYGYSYATQHTKPPGFIIRPPLLRITTRLWGSGNGTWDLEPDSQQSELRAEYSVLSSQTTVAVAAPHQSR
jgi:hypothetical protein